MIVSTSSRSPPVSGWAARTALPAVCVSVATAKPIAVPLGRSFQQLPILRLAKLRLDVPAILLGLLPFVHSANVAAFVYDRIVFKGTKLQDLPQRPRFVFTSTSLQTGVLWRFARDYAAEWRVGEWKNPDMKLALAVAASAAFPPLLSPLSLTPSKDAITSLPGINLSRTSFRTKLLLTDGGVYDNLALEPVWKRYRTILAVC
jgi:NTE family protein